MALTALPHVPDSPQVQAADDCHLETQLHWHMLGTVNFLPDCDPAESAAAALTLGHSWAVQHLALTPLTAVVQAQLASASPSRGVDTPLAELGTTHAAPKEMHMPLNLLLMLQCTLLWMVPCRTIPWLHVCFSHALIIAYTSCLAELLSLAMP